MPRVLAIDPGSKCGFAVVDDGGLVLSDCWHLTRSGERPGTRFWRLFHRLSETYAAVGKPDAFAYEGRIMGSGPGETSAKWTNYGGIIGVSLAWCEQVGVLDVHTMMPATLKKRATGNGRAEKADMAAWASHRSGRDIRDDNEADAVCLAFVVHEELTR